MTNMHLWCKVARRATGIAAAAGSGNLLGPLMPVGAVLGADPGEAGRN